MVKVLSRREIISQRIPTAAEDYKAIYLFIYLFYEASA